MMGIHYRVESRTAFSTITFAENLLGIVEAAFALATWENLAFIIDKVDILVDVSHSGSNPPPIDLGQQTTRPAYEFLWRDDMLDWMHQTQPSEVNEYFWQFLLKTLIDITIDPVADLTDELDRWHEEFSFSRALATSPISIAIADLIETDTYDIVSSSQSTAT